MHGHGEEVDQGPTGEAEAKEAERRELIAMVETLRDMPVEELDRISDDSLAQAEKEEKEWPYEQKHSALMYARSEAYSLRAYLVRSGLVPQPGENPEAVHEINDSKDVNIEDISPDELMELSLVRLAQGETRYAVAQLTHHWPAQKFSASAAYATRALNMQKR